MLSIQNIACETLGSLENLFKYDGFEIQNINAQSDSIPEKSDGCSAIVVLGGPMAVYDNLPYLQKEQALIRDAVENNVPVLGICLGSQLIAQATGGRVYKGNRKEIGWHDVSVSPAGKNSLFSGIDQNMRVFQWHGDTYQLPATAEVLAYSDLYPQAFRVGSAIGIQFHLEVDARLIKRWMKEYDGEVKSEGIDSQKILPKAGDVEQLSEKCRVVYRNFAKMIR